MPINFQCEKCSKQIVTAGKNVGSTIKCPGCQGDVLVPNPNKLPSQIIQKAAPAPLPAVDSKMSSKSNAVPAQDTPEIQIREPDPLPTAFSDGGKAKPLGNSSAGQVKKEIINPQKNKQTKTLILVIIVLVLGICAMVTCICGAIVIYLMLSTSLEQSLMAHMNKQGGKGNFMSRDDLSQKDKKDMMQPHLEAVRRAMQVFQTSDANESIKHIMELCGRDISSFSPEEAKELTAKFNRIDDMAKKYDRSAKEIVETMVTMRKTYNKAGPGGVPGYTGSSGTSTFAQAESYEAEVTTIRIYETAKSKGYNQEELEDLKKVVIKQIYLTK